MRAATPPPALPPFLGFDLEVSAPCNAHCDFCPQSWHGVARRRPYPTPELLTRIAREVEGVLDAQRAQHLGARSLFGFCGMGESLLRKDLVLHFLAECRLPESTDVVIVTNGALLTEDFVTHERFARVDGVTVSMTGWGASHEALYGIDFARVLDNVLAAHARYPGKLRIGWVDTPEVPPEDLATAQQFFGERGIAFGLSPMHSRGGHYAHPAAYPGSTREFSSCGVFSKLCFISSDGDVLACCHDVRSDHVMGSLADEPLLSIISRKQRRQREGRGFAICEKCTDFSIRQ